MQFLKLASVLVILSCISCDGPSPDSNWRERTDLIGANGEVISGAQAEQAGLVVYNILKFILKEESFDTLDISSTPLPWVKLEERSLNLDLLKDIKNGFTFKSQTTIFLPKTPYPTFYFDLGTFPADDKTVRGTNSRWQLKNHIYSFKDENGKEVEIDFFNEPKTLPIRSYSTTTFTDDKNSISTVNYFNELQYKPKDENVKIKSGSASFEIHLKKGFKREELNFKSKGKSISVDGTDIKIRDFKKDFVVFELPKGASPKFSIIGLAKDGNRYRTKPKKKTLSFFGGKAGKMNVSRIIWEYVESKNYKIEKESFLAWFASEILTNRGRYSKEEKEAQLTIAYSIGDLNSMILYTPIIEKEMDFKMEL